MANFVYAADVNTAQTTLTSLKTAGNIAAVIPVVATVYKGSLIAKTDFQKLVQAINILESNFSNNCNCKLGTSKCQTCQTPRYVCQGCQACQTCQVCQTCQSQWNCNCDCSDGNDGGGA